MKSANNVIIVPYDFTEVSENAVNHAAGLAKQKGWEVRLLHIINRDTRTLLNVYKVTDDIVGERLQEKVDEYSNQFGVPFSFDAREGSIFNDIAKGAEEANAELIVMGTHGKQGIQHIFGSYAHKVISSTRIPLIVVQKRDFREGYNKIVIPIDDTLESRQKIKWAISVAKLFDTKIYVKAMFINDELYKAKIRAILTKIVEVFEKNEVQFEAEILPETGSFAKQLIDYCKRIDADMLLIMANTDSSIVPNFILNPWDEQIIFNEASIPVMAINPRDINISVVGL